MLRLRVTIDAIGTRAKIDRLAAVVRRETEGAEADLFDDAIAAALAGVAAAVKGRG